MTAPSGLLAPLRRPFSHMRAHSQVLELRTQTHLWGGDHPLHWSLPLSGPQILTATPSAKHTAPSKLSPSSQPTKAWTVTPRSSTQNQPQSPKSHQGHHPNEAECGPFWVRTLLHGWTSDPRNKSPASKIQLCDRHATDTSFLKGKNGRNEAISSHKQV